MNKYRNKPIVIDGIWFQSKKEGKRWGELRLLEKAGEITRLKRQLPFPLNVNGEKIGKYMADFVYTDARGKDVVEDVKGVLTSVYKLKKKLMWAIYRIDITEIK